MNEWLAQYFGTAPVSEEAEKQASAELFVKLAMENGIDLNAMTDAEVQELYESTMGKMAESEEEEEDEEEKEKLRKIEEAAREHEAKKESQAKFAEAVFMGQTMAHAFTAELDAIENQKTAAGLKHEVKRFVKAPLKYITGGIQQARRANEALEEWTRYYKQRSKSTDPAQRIEDWRTYNRTANKLKKVRNRGIARAAIPVGGAALAIGGAGAGAGALAHKALSNREKKSSALDELAAELAVEKVASAGWDVDEAADRIAAVVTLGVDDETSKVAYAQDLDEAVEVRSLELAEAAGYPINWQ